MEYCYSGTESLWYGSWNRHVCRKGKCAANLHSRSTGVNSSRKQRCCSQSFLWSQAQRDTFDKYASPKWDSSRRRSGATVFSAGIWHNRKKWPMETIWNSVKRPNSVIRSSSWNFSKYFLNLPSNIIYNPLYSKWQICKKDSWSKSLCRHNR